MNVIEAGGSEDVGRKVRGGEGGEVGRADEARSSDERALV